MDLAPTLRKCGLDPTLVARPEGFISRHAFSNCLEQLAHEYRCPHLGLVVARHGESLGMGALALLARASATIGSALDAGYPRMSLYTDTQWRQQRDDSHVTLVRTVPRGIDGRASQFQAMSVAQHLLLLREVLGPTWAPSAVSFTFPRPPERQHYRRFFGAPVYFEQEHAGIRLPIEVLDTPVPGHNPELLAIIEHYLDNNHLVVDQGLPGKISTIIRQQLASGGCNAESVASALGWHAKTLQRALRREGSSFKALLLQNRLDLAEYHLSSSPVDLAQLADMLGYSSASALSRAFKQRHGLSPRAWRQRHAAGAKVAPFVDYLAG
ncbi:AraC family transcriptional regulator [Parahaliea maris]|nr:AraC family transcriptional regulator [Parahaliea maris]